MTGRSGWVIHRYDTVSSTMDQAAALARHGVRERSVVVSGEQTAGRGRAGRGWQAPSGSGLFCTLILRPNVIPTRLGTLPLLAGVAVAEAIESITGIAARLKWPNDVWLGENSGHPKVAGVLTTSQVQGDRVDHVMIGIGVNLSARREELPSGATSVLMATGVAVAPMDMLPYVLCCFDRQYTGFLASQGRPALDAWRARAVLVGEPVSVLENGRAVSGMLAGVDDDGALLLARADGEVRRILAGDLTRGPRSLDQPA